jgi:hypothetical protein
MIHSIGPDSSRYWKPFRLGAAPRSAKGSSRPTTRCQSAGRDVRSHRSPRAHSRTGGGASHQRPGGAQSVGGLAQWGTGARDGALQVPQRVVPVRHARSGGGGRRQTLGRADRDTRDLRGRPDHRRLKRRGRPAQRPRPAPPRRTRRTRTSRAPSPAQAELHLPHKHYGLREGDRIVFTAQHREPGQPRVENGSRGQVTDISHDRGVTVALDISERQVTMAGEDLESLRLGYAQHIHGQQGATVDRTVVVTGGWQTSREGSYVEASRARHGTEWFVNRDELDLAGQDERLVERLSEKMRTSRAQTPSRPRRAGSERPRRPRASPAHGAAARGGLSPTAATLHGGRRCGEL